METDNAELIGKQQVRCLEAWLRLYDTPTKSGTFEGKESGGIAQALQDSGFIRPYGKDKTKQIWQCVTSHLSFEDIGMIRRIVNAQRKPEFIPYHDLVPQLDYNQSMRLRDILQAGQIEKRDIEGINAETDSKLIELGFCVAEDNLLKLSPNLKFNDYDYNLMQLVIDQINSTNERKAAENLRLERMSR